MDQDKRRTTPRSFAGWCATIVCGVGACAATLAFMGQWPSARNQQATLIDRPPVGAMKPAPTSPSVVTAQNKRPAGPIYYESLDVLAKLEDAVRRVPVIPRSPSQSNTLEEAYSRALIYTSYSSVAARSDPEGLFEAAAWATGCIRATRVRTSSLRCNDTRLHDANLAETLLRSAASKGQPGAIIELAVRYPTKWNAIAFPDGTMLVDHLFAMAAHGDPQALQLIKQLCRSPGACKDAAFIRKVLTALQIQFSGPASSAQYQRYIIASSDERQRAVLRATQLRERLDRLDRSRS